MFVSVESIPGVNRAKARGLCWRELHETVFKAEIFFGLSLIIGDRRNGHNDGNFFFYSTLYKEGKDCLNSTDQISIFLYSTHLYLFLSISSK